jgi:hypothetical protein
MKIPSGLLETEKLIPKSYGNMTMSKMGLLCQA